MKKKVRLLSTMLVLFVLLHVFALNVFAIGFNSNSYIGMNGTLIPNWYWVYTGGYNLTWANADCHFSHTYTTHFFSYTSSFSITTYSNFTAGAYDVIIGPTFKYSRWWPSLASDPHDSTTTYTLSSNTTFFIMGPDATYNMPCFSESHTSECLGFASYEFSVKNSSTNSVIIDDYNYTKHNSYG